MKKLLAFLLLASSAFGATVTLSTGATCDYKAITFAANGSEYVQCVDVGVVTPVPPNPPTPPAPPAGNYVASGMWLYGQNRFSFNLNVASPSKEGYFTIPSGWSGLVEFPLSGANTNIYVDNVLTSSDGRPMAPGPHSLRVQLTTGATAADGSVGVAHSP